MKLTATFEPRNRQDWRDWLARNHNHNHNHNQVKEIWLIFLKKHTQKATFSYQDALEEALCFGWIDGVRQRIDEQRYAQRFSPRIKSSHWSDANLALAAVLEAKGHMTAAGLASKPPSGPPSAHPPNRQGSDIPDWLVAALRSDATAWTNFLGLPPSHQRRYVGWISAAKREDTRTRRITEAIALLRENKRIGLGPGEVRK
jgi:uncharacterized protein YdeI (YjbR/CyaY-like superfamily)